MTHQEALERELAKLEEKLRTLPRDKDFAAAEIVIGKRTADILTELHDLKQRVMG